MFNTGAQFQPIQVNAPTPLAVSNQGNQAIVAPPTGQIGETTPINF